LTPIECRPLPATFYDDVIELLSEELTNLARLVVSEQKRERVPRV
jgi:hypothetical protein